VTDWNFADVWEAVAEALPDAPATSHDGVRRSWSTFEARSEAQAAWLGSLGVERQARVAQYLYSGPAYLESLFGCFKAGLVPVNTNYRYGVDELAYLWHDAGCSAVVFHGAFAERIEEVRARADDLAIRGWLWVDDGSGPKPEWAVDVEEIATSAARCATPPPRSGDDLWLLYTGGTTGRPKGVMWRQDDMFCVVNRTSAVRYPEHADPSVIAGTLERPGPVLIPAAPLMHGTGAIAAFGALCAGGCVATLPSRSFRAEELLDLIESERAKAVAIVGDAFAKPVLAALDRHPGRWDISSLRIVVSSGVAWSTATKEGLLRHNPELTLADTLGASEAIGMASSISTRERPASSRFVSGPDTRVLGDDGRAIEAGSGETGLLALRGRSPIGYWGDPDKSARTFRVIDGERWSIPGDHAVIEADGTITLLGRGSQCINTGGEKVYPEEVEEALKAHPTVADAAVVGVPDDRFGQAVTALVAPSPGATCDGDALVEHVKSSLAAYKAPRHVIVVDDLGRAPSGKLDYRALASLAQGSSQP
jgi:acyl-CoA synthetase (AMP-forming)/AMP-acid ligase II